MTPARETGETVDRKESETPEDAFFNNFDFWWETCGQLHFEKREQERAKNGAKLAWEAVERLKKPSGSESTVRPKNGPFLEGSFCALDPRWVQYVDALERRLAECRTMLHGEHDAHMECHARAEKAEAALAAVVAAAIRALQDGHSDSPGQSAAGTGEPTKP